jgi:hypothetical protein
LDGGVVPDFSGGELPDLPELSPATACFCGEDMAVVEDLERL